MSRVVIAVSALLGAVLGLGGAAAQSEPDQAEGAVISYDEALTLVVQNAPELKLADEDVRDAQRRVTRAKRQYEPRLKMQGTAEGNLFDVTQWGGSQNFGAGMVLDWSPFRNGELLRENATARGGLTVAALNRRAAALELEQQFRALYYDILNLEDDAALGELKRDLEEQKLQTLEKDLELGRSNESDVLKQKGVFFEADAAWRKSRQDLQLKLIELAQRAGRDDLAGVEDVDRTVEPVGDLTVADCLAAAPGRRIALLAGREQVRLGDLGVKYAKLKRLPSVYFFTDSDYRLTEQLGNRPFELRAGVTVSYPLYGAGDTAAVIADAKAAAVRARIQYSQTRLKVEQEIREAYWAYVNTTRLLESTHEREQVFEDDFKNAAVLHERGALGEMEFMAAEIRYRESRKRIRTLELDALLARAALVKAAGVLSLDEIEPAKAAPAAEPVGSSGGKESE